MRSVSVVIPAHNEERTLGMVLDGLARQDRSGLDVEVVVVDDCSRDRTPDIVQKYAGEHSWIRLLQNEKNLGLSGTLTRGIRETKGEVVVTLHADIVPHDGDWLNALVAPFDDAGVGAVGCVMHSKVKGLPLVDRFFLEGPPAKMMGNKSDAYRRKVFEEVGGFDTSFRVAGEDVDLTERIKAAGYRIAFIDKGVDHLMGWHQMGFTKQLRKEIQYAEVQPRLHKRHGFSIATLHGSTVALLPVNLLLIPWQAALAPFLWAVNLLLLGFAVWTCRRWAPRFTLSFSLLYLAFGAAAAVALGKAPLAHPATVYLLGVLVTFLGWNGARSVVKSLRMRDPAILVAGVPLFFLQDFFRGVGVIKGARGFWTG